MVAIIKLLDKRNFTLSEKCFLLLKNLTTENKLLMTVTVLLIAAFLRRAFSIKFSKASKLAPVGNRYRTRREMIDNNGNLVEQHM